LGLAPPSRGRSLTNGIRVSSFAIMLVSKAKQQVILQVQTKYFLRFSTFLTTFVLLFKETTIAINL